MKDAAPAYVKQNVQDEVLVLTPQIDQLRDSDVCYSIRDEMTAAVTDTVPQRVVIDMRNVNFVSSIGILAFLNLRRAIPPTGQRIVFCNLSPQLHGMFRLCRLISDNPEDSSPFAAVETLESALSPA